MRHVYECPLRWADLDLLGHVNNVIYVDYLQEARIDMLRVHAPDRRTDELAEGVVVVRHEVGYVAPLTRIDRPVTIESWVTEIRAASFTMAYEVFHEGADGVRTVYLRATTLLTPYVFATERPRRLTADEKEVLARFLEPTEAGKAAMPGPRPERTGVYALQVRFSDVDVYGHVNNVKYFEYLQEARIVFFRDAGRDDQEPLGMVVAQCNVDYKVPILFRPEPYRVHSWISRVGSSSFTIDSEIVDGDMILARARVVLVCFDPTTERARPIPDWMRPGLEEFLTPAS